MGDAITPGEESIEDAVARLNRESAAAQERMRAERAAREAQSRSSVDARDSARSADEARARREARAAEVARQQAQPGRAAPQPPRPAPSPRPAPRPAAPAPARPPDPVPGNASGQAPAGTPRAYQAVYGALSGALAQQGWTGSGVGTSAGAPGSGAVLIPSYAVQLAWGRIIAGAVATFIGYQFSNWVVPDPFGLIFVAPGLLWVVTGILRVRGASSERAWADHQGLHVVDAKGERVVPWRELARVEAVARGSSSDKRRGRIELTLADGTRLTPRMWNGASLTQTRMVADRIRAAQAGFTRRSTGS
ncbi:MAG: hypothetical protein AB7O74_04860 [Candidatus Nanopelagicales bacterium]